MFLIPRYSKSKNIHYSVKDTNPLYIKGKCNNLSSDIISINAPLFNPSFTSENPAKVTSLGRGYYSTQDNGVWEATAAYLAEGWINEGNWQVDFDLAANGLRYIWIAILVSLEPSVSRLIGGWEGPLAGTPPGTVTRDNDSTLSVLNGNIWNNPSVDWCHITMEKTSPTTLSITKTGDKVNNGTVNYNWQELSNYPKLTIGVWNNGGSSIGHLKIRNLKVVSL